MNASSRARGCRGDRRPASLNPKSKIQSPKSNAFTLIEVLIAIVLTLALITAMYGFAYDMLTSRSRVLEHVWQETAAAAVVKQLDADLMTCVVGDAVSGAGVHGDETDLRILSRGVAANLAARGVDDPDLFGDLQLIEYRLNAQQKRIEGRRAPIGRQNATPPEFTAIEGVVHDMRFRYYDGEQWRTSFNSLTENRLPVAVEVSFWFSPRIAEDEQARAVSDSEAARDALNDDDDDDTALLLNDDFTSPEPIDTDAERPPDRVRVFLIPDARHQPAEDELEASGEPIVGEAAEADES